MEKHGTFLAVSGLQKLPQERSDNSSKWVTKEPRSSSKELHLPVHESTMRKRQKWHAWQSSKVKASADQKEHKGSSHFCQKIPWCLLGQYSVDWQKRDVHPVTSGIKVIRRLKNKNIQWNMVVVGWWSGVASLLQDLDNLVWLMKSWILLSTQKSRRRISSWPWAEMSWNILQRDNDPTHTSKSTSEWLWMALKEQLVA